MNDLAIKVKAFEKSLLVAAMTRFNGNRSAVATDFKMSRNALYDRLEIHKILVGDFKKKKPKKTGWDYKHGSRRVPPLI